MAGAEKHVRLEARPDTDTEWRHVKSVPAWAMADRDAARVQRAHVREMCRDEWGQDSPVLVRVVDDEE